MRHNDGLLHWESGSRSRYAQITLLDRVFCFIIRVPRERGDEPP